MRGLKRVIHYWSWVSTKLVAMGIGFTVLFSCFFGFMDGGMEEFIRMADIYCLLFGVYFGLAAQVSASQVNLNQTLTMGASRKHSFVGLQYVNLFIAAAFLIIDLLFRKITGGIYSDWGISGKYFFVAYISIVLLVDGIGNVLSVLIMRLGKVGVYIFCGGSLVLGGISGFFYVVIQKGGADTLFSIINTGVISPVIIVLVGSFLIYAVCSVIQYFMLQKYEIRA